MLCCLFSSCTDEGIKREWIKAAAYKCLTWILSVVKERVVTWKPEATDEFFCENKPEINKPARISFETFFPSHSEVTKTTGFLYLITNGLSGCLVLIISVCVLLKTLKHIKVETEERKNTSKKCLEQSSDSKQSQSAPEQLAASQCLGVISKMKMGRDWEMASVQAHSRVRLSHQGATGRFPTVQKCTIP